MFITKRLYKIERAKFLLTIPHSDNSSPRYNRQHTDLEKNQTFPGLFSYHTKQRYSMLRIIKYFAFLFAFGRGMGIRLKASYMLGKQVPPPPWNSTPPSQTAPLDVLQALRIPALQPGRLLSNSYMAASLLVAGYECCGKRPFIQTLCPDAQCC